MSVIPSVITLDDAAKRLLTTADKLKKEIEANRLRAFSIGEDDWRVTETALLEFIGEEDVKRPAKGRGKPGADRTRVADGRLALAGMGDVQWHRSEPFSYQWPDEKLEQMQPCYTAHIDVNGVHRAFTIGFTNRQAAGMMRRRAVVFLGSPSRRLRPVVEFAGSNDFETTGRMASPIKVAGECGSKWRVVQIVEQLPSDYFGLDISEYSEIVSGPNATKAAAVVVDKDNLTAMARHAFIRARWKGWV